MFKEDLESMKLNQTQPANSTMFKEDLESMKLNEIMLSILKNVYSVCNLKKNFKKDYADQQFLPKDISKKKQS